VLGLDAKDPARRENCVVDLGKATIGARQYEIVQDVRATFCQSRPNPDLPDLAGNKFGNVIGNGTENERQQQSPSNGEGRW
jgi:hypothetical protein